MAAEPLPLPAIQAALKEEGLDGWLFCDFRGSDPIAARILRLPPGQMTTRRWCVLVPRRGLPSKLVHRIEPHALEAVPGDTTLYSTWRELETGLERMLEGLNRVAMQYSPRNAIPSIARVDAGTLELVRSCEVVPVSSADLVQRFEAVWSAAQAESHRRAAGHLRRIVDGAFAFFAERMRSGSGATEHEVRDFLLREIERRGLVCDHPPIVAAGSHSADPHYTPAGEAVIQEGDLLLLDLWAKESVPGAVYADITWTAVAGRSVPDEMARVFEVVKTARDATLAKIADAALEDTPVRGCDADDAARAVITKAGYGACFPHRTGHSLGEEVHGNGANLDNHETVDTRRLIPGTGFSIEPGIYLPGRFGIRSEINVYLNDGDAEVTAQPVQSRLASLL